MKKGKFENKRRRATKTEPEQRIILLPGDQGEIACRLHSGWNTIPRMSSEGFISMTARTQLRLRNIALFRGTPNDLDLSKSMIGPTNFLGTLVNIDRYTYMITISSHGLPKFNKYRMKHKVKKIRKPPPFEKYLFQFSSRDWKWYSGKDHENKQIINKALKIDNVASLTPDPGIITSSFKEIILPKFNPIGYDLSGFRAELVKNDRNFSLVLEKEDTMDVITYRFGKFYADYAIKNGSGLFLEKHNFTQIITPLTPYCSGFITIGKIIDNKLQLIGFKIPYNYSLIIRKNAIHGDATLIGNYGMAMTVNHKTMRTANVGFIKKNETYENVILKCEGYSNQNQVASQQRNYPQLTPLIFPKFGPCKKIFCQSAMQQIRNIKLPGLAITRVVANSYSPTWRHYVSISPAHAFSKANDVSTLCHDELFSRLRKGKPPSLDNWMKIFNYIATISGSYSQVTPYLAYQAYRFPYTLTSDHLLAILDASNDAVKFLIASDLFKEEVLRNIILQSYDALQAWHIITKKNTQEFLKHVTSENFLTIANADSSYLEALLRSGVKFLNLLAATLPEKSAGQHLADIVRESSPSIVKIIVNMPEFIDAITDDPSAAKTCCQQYPNKFLPIFQETFPKKSLPPPACLKIAYTDPSLAYLMLTSHRLPLSKENQQTLRNDRITAFNLILLLDKLQLPACGQQSSKVLFMVFSYLAGSFLCSPQERDERCQVYDRLLQKRKDIEQRPSVKTGRLIMGLFQKQKQPVITLGTGQQKQVTATTKNEHKHVQEAMDAALFAPPPLKEFEFMC